MRSRKRFLEAGLLRPLAFMACLLIAAQTYAQTSVDQMLRTGGLDRQLELSYEAVPKQFAIGIQQASGLAIGDDIQALAKESLSSKEIYATTVKRLEANLNAEQVEEVMGWLKSDLGQKITELEVDASSVDHQEKVAAQLDSIAADEGVMRRGAEIDALLNVTNQTMSQIELVQVATLEGLLGAQNPDADTSADVDTLKSQMLQGLQQARPQIEQVTQATVGYTYRSLSDQEYTQYRKFLQTPTSKVLHEQIAAAHLEAAQVQFKTLGQKIASYLEKVQREQ